MNRFANTLAFVAIRELQFDSGDCIGEGSISIVFKGKLNGKSVAVKVLRTDTDDLDANGLPYFAHDLVHELNIVERRLSHPNVMGFIGAGTTQHCGAEVPMIIYQYVSGGSVDHMFRRKTAENGGKVWKPPSALSLSWCRQLLSALAYLHNLEQPLAHRDVKPDNLLISADLVSLTLADFSLAKAICAPPSPADPDFASVPSIAGSLRYMAPEISARLPCDLAKTDVYSAALTCWALCHGQRPFSSVEGNLAHVLATSGVRPPLHTRSSSQASLFRLLAAAWDPLPVQRPSTNAMLAELEQLEQRKNARRMAAPAAWGKRMLRLVRLVRGSREAPLQP